MQRSFLCLFAVFALGATPALAQSDAIRLRSDDSVSDRIRLRVLTSLSSPGTADVFIQDARLRFNTATGFLNVESAAATTPVSGDLRFDGTDVRYYDGAWRTLARVSDSSAGYVLLAPGASAQSSTATTSLIHLDETGAGTPNLLELESAGTDRFVVTNAGLVTTGGDVQVGGDVITAAADGVLNAGGSLSATINVIGDTASPTINFVNGDEDLFIEDDLEVAGTLYVGNPSSPQSVTGVQAKLFSQSFDATVPGWTSQQVCGAVAWLAISTAPGQGAFRFDNFGGGRARANLLSPWIWVPTGATNVRASFWALSTLEANFDGAFLEFSTDGTAWTKITSFAVGGYGPNFVQGSNTTCTGSSNQVAWDNEGANALPHETSNLGVAGTWIRFRFVGMEDATVGTGLFEFYGFALRGDVPTSGGSFDVGDIYAEGNVYAGSNRLLGDVAEYMPVHGAAEPGDVLVLDPARAERLQISRAAYAPQVIGVYSTAPTVSLNKPQAGVPVALAGKVPVKVTLENGKIEIGDYLTTSSTPGHAMRADRACQVLGRAMAPFDGSKSETGKIICLVQPTWYAPAASGAIGPAAVGRFSAKQGASSVQIQDAAVQLGSVVSLTMLSDPGARFWIQGQQDGQFTVAFSEALSEAVKGNYLVFGPQTVRAEAQTPAKQHPAKGTFSDARSKALASTGKPLPPFDPRHATPPPLPPERDLLWNWSPTDGLQPGKRSQGKRRIQEGSEGS